MENLETYTVLRLEEPSMKLVLVQSFWKLEDARQKQEYLKSNNQISFVFKTI